ncbi:MAG TPA: GspH/FimT family pseudopilin [Gemmatimonadales bacterium]|nr:GspH/FimT family pseudopilin [Gemmatimonadales bacterium]
MRRAFTLPELLLVLALTAVLLGVAIPRFSAVLDRIEVSAAAGHVAAAHSRARLMAVTQGIVAILSVDTFALTIRRRGAIEPLWTEPGPAAHRVALAGPVRQFTFSPEGFSLGLSNATIRLSRGSATRNVIVSRLGRVRVTN